MKRLSLAILAIALMSSAPVAAATRHRHRALPARPARAEAVPATAPPSFYPQEIQGGVSGNLPFNNQIRKHTDPLNANGGR